MILDPNPLKLLVRLSDQLDDAERENANAQATIANLYAVEARHVEALEAADADKTARQEALLTFFRRIFGYADQGEFSLEHIVANLESRFGGEGQSIQALEKTIWDALGYVAEDLEEPFTLWGGVQDLIDRHAADTETIEYLDGELFDALFADDDEALEPE